jgi:CRISPR-associated protein Cas2
MSMKNSRMIEDDEFVPGSISWMLGRQNDDFLAEETELIEKVGNRTYFVVVIYDVVDNKSRTQLSKTLLGYGVRVQRSAFECHLTQRKYESMISDALRFIDESQDLLRVYKLSGSAETRCWGQVPETFDEDLIII